MKAPRRGMPSPPRLELSGSEPSHEPQPRSVNSTEKATPTQRTAITTATEPGVSVEGMRTEISPDACDGALLQPGMPAEGQRVVAMEKPRAVAAIRERSQEAAGTKRSPSKTAATGWTCGITAGKRRAWVITRRIQAKFFRTPAIVQAATSVFSERGGHRCNDSAPMNAGAR